MACGWDWGTARETRAASSGWSTGSARLRAKDEPNSARCGWGLSNELSWVPRRDSASKRVGISSKASATNASEPAVSPTLGAQRHSTKSLTN
jgi:hypothetical protein